MKVATQLTLFLLAAGIGYGLLFFAAAMSASAAGGCGGG